MKKLVSIILALVMLSMVGINAFAATPIDTTEVTLNSLQSVIDEVNEKYGLNYKLPSVDEMKEAISQTSEISDISDISISDFRDELMKVAEKAYTYEMQVSRQWKQAEMAASLEENIMSYDNNAQVQSTVVNERYPKTFRKVKDGAIVYLEGWVNKYSGYWKWESPITKVWSLKDDDNTSNRFVMEDYSYKFIDAARTCATTLTGIMYDKVLVFWVPRDGSVYVEFYAGS